MAVEPKRAKSLFLAASGLASPAERAAYLDRECSGQTGLRAQVEELLAADAALGLALGSTSAAGETLDAESGPIRSRPGAMIPSDAPGLILAGKYKLLERIGEGGMGSVWLAQQSEPVKRKVAVKLIKLGMDSRQVLTRFEAERQALALMDHPNIAKVLDGGLAPDGRPFFVMELVKGTPITDYCDACKLSLKQRLELFVPVCQAIQHAHQKGIIHRDIKPSNVMIAMYDDRPVPKVIDFGVAKATGQQLTEVTLNTGFGGVVGTPQYMSPEQATLNNLDIDTRSDVYSLGVVLYELLTGSPPFTKEDLEKKGLMEVLRVVREDEPPKPSTRLSTAAMLPMLSANRSMEPRRLTQMLRSDLDWIVLKALEKNRTRRYETANGLAADVQRYLAGEPVAAHPPSAGYLMKKFLRRHRPQVVAASLVLLVLLAGIAGTTFGLIRANRSAEAERLAKHKAEQATDAEKAAHAQAQKRLAQIEKANDILGSIFENLDPKEIARNERPLQAILVEKLDKAVAQLEGEAIGDPLVVAAMQDKLGRSLLGLGQPDKAIMLFEEERATCRAKFGPEHPATLRLMNNLADAYKDAGKLDLAVPLFEETLKLMTAKLGPDHADTLSARFNLAQAYRAAGKLDLVLPLCEETLKLSIAKLGPDHANTLSAMNELGLAYQNAGKLDLAVPLLQETLRLSIAKLGPDHPDTLTNMNNLALAYQDAKKLDLALPLYEETLKIRKAKIGPDHPKTLLSMTNLATAYQNAGKLDLALPLFEETLKLSKAKLGPEHPMTLTTMNNLAWAYQDAGKLDLAVPLFEETLKLSKAKLGPEHPRTLTTMNNLLRAYAKAGETAKAGKLLSDLRRWQPKDSPQLAQDLATYCLLLLKSKSFLDAEPLLRDCLTIRQKTQPDVWSTFNTQAMLGQALLGQKNYPDAEPLLLAGYKGMKQREQTIPANGKIRLSEAADRLFELYTATGKPEEAKKWQAERAKYPSAATQPVE